MNKELRIAMTENNIANLKELSELTGLSYPTIYNTAWGKSTPTIDTAEKIGKVLKLNVNDVWNMLKGE